MEHFHHHHAFLFNFQIFPSNPIAIYFYFLFSTELIHSFVSRACLNTFIHYIDKKCFQNIVHLNIDYYPGLFVPTIFSKVSINVFCIIQIQGAMPKKFQGENTKAVAARVRKTEAKVQEKTRIEQEKEEAYWVDDDKHANRKAQRKVCILLPVD